MNHVDRNRVNNFICRYCIKNTAENFNKLAKMITKRKFYIYRTIWYITDNCRIVEEDSTEIAIEICFNEHRDLLKDLMENFFTKINRTRKAETKVWHGYVTGNPFLTIAIVIVFHGINQEN